MTDSSCGDICAGPYPLVHSPDHRGLQQTPFVAAAAHMATIHNVLIRILNSIVLQADGIERAGTKKDVTEFVWYTRQWYRLLHHHHEYEENYLFGPIARRAGDQDLFANAYAQHKSFESGLESYRAYVFSSCAIRHFNATKLKSIIDIKLAPPLLIHLHEEIRDIVELADCDGLDGEFIAQAFADCEFVSRGAASLSTQAPFAFGGANNLFEDGRSYFPHWSLAGWLLVCCCLWYAHSGSWRFLPSDSFGNPKKRLEFFPQLPV